MPDIAQRLRDLSITLPKPPSPVAAYIPTVRSGRLVYVSGQLPFVDGKLMAEGTVPAKVSVEKAKECARRCVINGLAALQGEIGSLDRVRRDVRVGVWVASEPGFGDQPKVANGASELLQEIFGEAGRHARAAVGSIALPLNTPVEVEFLFEVDDTELA